MKRWTRALYRRLCGFCGADVPKDSPYLSITFPQPTARDKVRCPACAGEPIPNDLPLIHVPDKATVNAVSGFSSAKVLAYDWKKRQAGD